MSIRNASLALVAGLTFAAPSAAFAAPTAPIVAQSERVVAPAPAAEPDVSGYADREAQNQQVANYEGGQTVVIAMSGGALLVLLFLLLVI